MEITVTQFKAKCLGLIEKVQREKCSVVISRHGRPAVQLLAVEKEIDSPFFGRAAGTVVLHEDVLDTGESWNADA
ncbi:MAG: type II toxin-antitoxin system prevent-host-death family antitoxin [Chthoniobacterales bacterium]|nr:type II toxin-antitoxin system prevent-host-death family antitoxin [Chthoniobacterales bacterium]